MGGGTKTVRLKGDAAAADREVGQTYREDFEAFMRDTLPLAQEQIASLNDNTMVKQAVADNAKRGELQTGATKRNVARYGMGMTTAQRNSMSKRQKMHSSATNAGSINNARLAQSDRNANVAMSLAGQGSSYRGQALNEMVSAVSQESGRMVGNAQSASQARGANLGSAMSMATMAMSV